ncbi:MAG: ABC transporter permease subunit, partial [Nonomuraea sp.]|nr:ABC transporter permease subunit [Nonomuraea sp.]
GLIDHYLQQIFGIDPIAWLVDSRWAMPAIVITTVWWTVGSNMVIYLAALQDIPSELYEAAEIDGAGAWRRFRSLTWPMLRNVNAFVIPFTFIGSWQVFGQVYLMTGGGPGTSTFVMSQYIYLTAFQRRVSPSWCGDPGVGRGRSWIPRYGRRTSTPPVRRCSSSWRPPWWRSTAARASRSASTPSPARPSAVTVSGGTRSWASPAGTPTWPGTCCARPAGSTTRRTAVTGDWPPRSSTRSPRCPRARRRGRASTWRRAGRCRPPRTRPATT